MALWTMYEALILSLTPGSVPMYGRAYGMSSFHKSCSSLLNAVVKCDIYYQA